MTEFEKYVNKVNSENRIIKSEKAVELASRIMGVGRQIKNKASMMKPQTEQEREAKVDELQANEWYEKIHNKYIASQGKYPVGTMEKLSYPNGEERMIFHTQNGSVRKSEYLVAPHEIDRGVISNTGYEGYSMVKNEKGQDELVYSLFLITQSNNHPKINVSGCMRDVNGKFTGFDYPAISANDFYHPELGDEVQKRFESLESTFNNEYEQFFANQQGEEPELNEVADDEASFQPQNSAQPKNFFQKAVDKVKDFFESGDPECGDW